jgi:hypothetical protein
MKTLSIIASSIVFSTVVAIGCFSTPQEQIVEAEKLVQRTSQIVLAKVVEARADLKTGLVIYSFRAEKVIKGKVSESFVIVGDALVDPEALTTFQDHRLDGFWEGDAGRCQHDADCKIHPSFVVGATYLVFMDQPYHRKSFEQIAMLGQDPDTKDKWLKWVEESVKAQPSR